MLIRARVLMERCSPSEGGACATCTPPPLVAPPDCGSDPPDAASMCAGSRDSFRPPARTPLRTLPRSPDPGLDIPSSCGDLADSQANWTEFNKSFRLSGACLDRICRDACRRVRCSTLRHGYLAQNKV